MPRVLVLSVKHIARREHGSIEQDLERMKETTITGVSMLQPYSVREKTNFAVTICAGGAS